MSAASAASAASSTSGHSKETQTAPSATTMTAPSFTSNKCFSLFQSSSQTSSIKLDRNNFLIWESVVLPLIEGNRLESHINGSGIIPLRYIPGDAGVVSNPEYEDWFATDRMLVGWLRNTMMPEVSAQLLHCKSARDLWIGARDLTSASTKARVMTFKSELHSTRKNSLRMEDYLGRMKNIADQLALAGAAISTEELVMHTLNGLDADYNAIVVKLIDQNESQLD